MTKEKGKKITIDQLAEMMQRSFRHMDERFDRLERKFDIMDAKVNVITKIGSHVLKMS